MTILVYTTYICRWSSNKASGETLVTVLSLGHYREKEAKDRIGMARPKCPPTALIIGGELELECGSSAVPGGLTFS